MNEFTPRERQIISSALSEKASRIHILKTNYLRCYQEECQVTRQFEEKYQELINLRHKVDFWDADRHAA